MHDILWQLICNAYSHYKFVYSIYTSSSLWPGKKKVHYNKKYNYTNGIINRIVNLFKGREFGGKSKWNKLHVHQNLLHLIVQNNLEKEELN